MRNVRTDDPHARKAWVIRIMDGLAKGKIRADLGAGLTSTRRAGAPPALRRRPPRRCALRHLHARHVAPAPSI